MNKIVKKTKRKDIGYKRPPIPGPGRPRGSVNKFTTLKNDYIWVHEAIGGRERLKAWAETHLTLFYQIESKLFPQELSGNLNVTGALSMTALKKSLEECGNEKD